MALFSQQQPSFSTFAKATGGRYDPTTPSGQARLRQDYLDAARRNEDFRNAASAVKERQALEEIMRPSEQVAPGVRAVRKDGQIVGYSKPIEPGQKAVFKDLPYGATSLEQVGEIARAIPADKRTARDEALAADTRATPFQKGFLAALQKAKPAQAAPAKPAEQVTETVTEKVTEKPVTAQAPAPAMSPAKLASEQTRLVQEMERLKNLTASQATPSMPQRQKFADIAHLYELLEPLRKQLETGTSPNNWGGAPIPLTPERRTALQQQVDELTNKIMEASAATQGFGVPKEEMKKYRALKEQLEALGIPAPF